jgi:hypothetical protein
MHGTQMKAAGELLLIVTVFLALSLPAFVFAMLTWAIVFSGRRVDLATGSVLFVLASASSCRLYGHGDPSFVVSTIAAEQPDSLTITIMWMATTGALVTGVIAWWSRHRPNEVVEPPSVME